MLFVYLFVVIQAVEIFYHLTPLKSKQDVPPYISQRFLISINPFQPQCAITITVFDFYIQGLT